MAKEQRILTERVEQVDVTPFVESLMYHGYSQITMLFDWKTGMWEISWPVKKEKEDIEQPPEE